jgi:hypothetical protein
VDFGAALGLVMSVVALVLSVSSFWQGRRRDKRDLFLNLHQVLISKEQANGRRIIMTAAEHERDGVDGAWSSLSQDDKDDLNRSLAYFDVLAMYVHAGHVDEREAREVWAPTYVRTVAAAEQFLRERRKAQPYLWRAMTRLQRDWEAYLAKRPAPEVTP